MKKLGVLIVVILAFVLSACGASLSSPEGAAAYLYNAMENGDKDKVKEALCDEQKDFADTVFEAGEGSEITYDFNFQYVTDDKKDNSATVKVYGHATIRQVTDDVDRELKSASRSDKPLIELSLVKDGDDWKVCSSPLAIAQ
ncbi:MAG: hypothetical protein H6673_02375 [Anaerolineales bacterium]|nr:hypothetical protein [Anaerolineales bacterium]